MQPLLLKEFFKNVKFRQSLSDFSCEVTTPPELRVSPQGTPFNAELQNWNLTLNQMETILVYPLCFLFQAAPRCLINK